MRHDRSGRGSRKSGDVRCREGLEAGCVAEVNAPLTRLSNLFFACLEGDENARSKHGYRRAACVKNSDIPSLLRDDACVPWKSVA